jgi:hypothetical protein
MSTTSDKILDFLADPGNLQIAYEIGDWLRDFESAVFGTFWSGVRDRLEQRLVEIGCSHTWRVWMSPSVLERESYLSILQGQKTDAEPDRSYSVTAECLGGRPSACYFGIFRGQTNDAALDKELQSEQFRSNAYWSGYQYFTALNLPDFRVHKDNVLRLNADNQSTGRPLARAVAARLCEVFERHRAQLERLNAGGGDLGAG